MSSTTTMTEEAPAEVSIIAENSAEILTLDELIRRRASELRGSTIFGYPKEGLLDYEEHSAQAVDRYVDAAAAVLQKRGLKPVDSTLEKAPVVGILAHSSLHFIITLLGLSRLGYASLLLSTRLASPAILRLLELAECDTILTTSTFHPVLAEVQAERKVTLLESLGREDYYGVDAPVFSRAYDPETENPKVAVIIHSSGSTGLPKPIYLTNRSCIAAFSANLDRRALMTQPLFHSFGFYETFRSMYSGKPMYYVNYSLPITKQNLTAIIGHVKPDLFFAVPYVLKLLGESEEGIRALANIDIVMYGGSACPDDLGDMLVKNGVNLVANYGATETSRLMTSVRPAGDLAWNYLRILPKVKQYVLMDELAPGIHECVALDGLKSKSTINSDDPPRSFRTKDLFMRHPDNPDFWKFVSRLDDRLTLVNGEKVLPIPIEGRIRQEGLVKEAVVFGDAKTVPGLLIVKADNAADMSDEEFLQAIWPAVEDANARAESFSRVPQELVVVLPAATIYACTDKGTFIRAQVYEQFKEQINTAYTNFESDADEGGTIALPLPELEQHLLQRFREHLGVELPSTETDFFAYGVDSLQGMKMWSLMKKELDLGGRQSQVGQNVLYETGNIAALARFLDGLRTGNEEAAQDQQQVMRDLIAKHSSFKKFEREKSKEVVVLTGATGGLGAHLLAQLVRDPNVSTVWALVRASSDHAALERTLKSLSSRDLYLTAEESRKVIAVPSDLSKPDFGLGPSRLEDLRSSLTLVIHSAWAVNFNISVSSFEDQHIKAIPNFINLCQSTTHGSPARFFFCSSVSSAAATPRPGSVPETPVKDIAHVQGTGYARSKFVAEHIVRNAAHDAGASARVLRIGQLIGDSKAGEWNTTEGIPLMIQTAETLGALPALDEEMSWLPVDYAASIIRDVCAAGNANPDLVYHVLNPTRFHWTRDMLPALAAAGLQFKTLPTDQWMDRLRNSDRDPKTNPPIKLLDWFESKYGPKASTVKKGALEYETTETRKDSETIGSVPDVTDKAYVKMVVERLRRHWDA
ncbi:acetyl-CoA synthetase-like protein [Dothidotthia symphoricarpi CBS 119687]|uniref:Acetyl-CoA synthetase-like protein n=1 Tax=Dothidotthia symphoricarpi CBS 119687 TaxID=1392245 RepID=A0A6A6AEQ2_9PLEO|nr:acetyl-CoA synthetase-like protein [Dothidotthia symphoricarpi CBS 119687]KAF2130442.1 acetyl-CoA synthetase-like protein [Dothidotthia symphoricarpi CBS 119687]